MLDTALNISGGLLKGVRHILDFEPDPSGWLTSEQVGKGLSVLQRKDLTFDLLLR